ncbi:MAG: hypothetical protein LUD72_04920 [Bacteroidales bacterium]|nr:hypothetical protein [Bacteroidales bacterium]
MSITNKIGPPVEGDDFFGRGKELEQANKLLEGNHSLLLSAPRRIGKSSFAKRLIEVERAKGWKCAYIDLEETTTEDGFLRLIIDTFSETGMWKRVTKEISAKLSSILDRFGKISVGSISLELAPKDAEENLYQDLKGLIRHDEDTLIVIDELSLFLGLLHKTTDGAKKTIYILNWLRSLRQINGTKVRWLFCGSVGLRNFTASLNLGYAINDLTEIDLGEMDREEAVGLLTGLCASEEIAMSKDLINYALDKLYWNIPYFIQVIFSKMAERKSEGISMDSINAAYRELCSGAYLNTWSERLTEYHEYESLARRILKSLSVKSEGMSRASLFNILMVETDIVKVEEMDYKLSKVLEMLENDGYIVKRESIRSFRSPLLRDYWFSKFVQ